MRRGSFGWSDLELLCRDERFIYVNDGMFQNYEILISVNIFTSK